MGMSKISVAKRAIVVMPTRGTSKKIPRISMVISFSITTFD
jgi:hypothetical protein